MIKNPFVYAQKKKFEIAKEQETEIDEIYKEAYEELRERFKRYLHLGTREAKHEMARVKQMKRDMQEVMHYVDNKTEDVILTNMDTTVQAVLENNQTFLNGIGYRDYINNPAIKADVVKSIVNGNVYNGDFKLSSAIWGDDKTKLDEINKVIAKGVLENKSVYDIAKDLEKYVNPDARKGYEWGRMFPGSRKVVDYNAQRLARTMIQHAYQKAFVSATINNPFIEAYRWVTSGGHNVCALCIERETTDQFGLGEGIFPKDQLPLDHPNGMCTFDVVVSMSYDEMSEAVSDWYLGEGDKTLNEQLDKFAKYLKDF